MVSRLSGVILERSSCRAASVISDRMGMNEPDIARLMRQLFDEAGHLGAHPLLRHIRGPWPPGDE